MFWRRRKRRKRLTLELTGKTIYVAAPGVLPRVPTMLRLVRNGVADNCELIQIVMMRGDYCKELQIWDSAEGGHMLATAPLLEPVTFDNDGDILQVVPGMLTIGLG